VIVECPLCHTRYRTDSSQIVEETTRFQCTKEDCEHIFHYVPPLLEGARPDFSLVTVPSQQDIAPPSEEPQAPEEKELTMPSEEIFPLEGPILTKPTEPIEKQPRLKERIERSAPRKSPLAQEDFFQTFTLAETPFYTDVEAAEREQTMVRFSSSSQPDREILLSPGAFVLFLGLLIFSNGMLGLYCFYHTEATEAFLARLPLLGGLVSGERVSARHIVLSDLEGRYQTTKDSQKVFTISGTATNDTALAARTIQIEGAIYDIKKKSVGQRLIFCGTNISPDRLTNLTAREIGALQGLVPPKQFHVLAGEAVKFLIVFTSPPSSVAEFSSRVVAAQFGSL
jgi:predicted Zn finger-like uncharacterized protein